MTPEVSRLNANLAAAQPSATDRMIDRVAERKTAGVPLLSLSADEPDFDTPQQVQDAAVAAIRAGHTRYTQVAGLRTLREAVADKHAARAGARTWLRCRSFSWPPRRKRCWRTSASTAFTWSASRWAD